MYWWVIYDITKNRARTRTASLCKRFGLRRVQKSVFLGALKHKRMNQLRTEINRLVNWRTDKVYFVPTNRQEYGRIAQTGPNKQAPILSPIPPFNEY
jgi:CRISPR-associated protein Cas2